MCILLYFYEFVLIMFNLQIISGIEILFADLIEQIGVFYATIKKFTIWFGSLISRLNKGVVNDHRSVKIFFGI